MIKVKYSIRLSFLEGIFSAAQGGLTDNFLTPYALALRATVPQIGLLSSIPQLLGALSQLACGTLSDWLRSRKKLIAVSAFAHACIWLPILSIPWILPQYGIQILIVLVTLAFAFAGFAGPAWMSLLSQYAPPSRRGRFFGTRQSLVGFTSVLVGFLAGGILHLFRSRVFVGFSILFAGAFIFRSISAFLLSRLYEPKSTNHLIRSSGLFHILRGPQFRPFWRVALFMGAMQAGVNLSAPYIAVYLLRDVGYTYPQYTLAMLVAATSGFCLMRPWGKLADRVGNARILRICSFCITFIPFLWLVSPRLEYLVWIQFFAGGVWGGFTLCGSNYVLDAVAPEHRTRCIAVFNIINSAGVFLGAFVGGSLAAHLPKIFGYQILTVFLISAFARIAAWLLLSGGVREVRPLRPLAPG